MIAHIRGQILSKTPDTMVVECGGYELAISVATYTELRDPGAEALPERLKAAIHATYVAEHG